MLRFEIINLYPNLFLFANLLFFIGLFGVFLNKRNILIILMSFEISLLGLNLAFIFTSLYLEDMVGQVFVLFILAIAAIEAAVGITFFIFYFKKVRTLSLEEFKQTRG